MAGLTPALEALAAEDLCALLPSELLARTAELVAARNRLDAELARTVRRAELAQAPQRDGLVSMASWLRGHARLSPAAAAQLVRVGRPPSSFPALAAGAASGLVSGEQLAVAAAITRPEHLAAAHKHGVELPEVDAVLAEVAAAARTPSCGRSSPTIWPGSIPTARNPIRPRAGRGRSPDAPTGA